MPKNHQCHHCGDIVYGLRPGVYKEKKRILSMDLSMFVMKSCVFSIACLRDLFAICQSSGIIAPAHFVLACISNKTTSAVANPFRQGATKDPLVAIRSMSPPASPLNSTPSANESHPSLVAIRLLRFPRLLGVAAHNLNFICMEFLTAIALELYILDQECPNIVAKSVCFQMSLQGS